MDAATRDVVCRRAGDRCEYCLRPQAASLLAFHVEHIVGHPKAETNVAGSNPLTLAVRHVGATRMSVEFRYQLSGKGWSECTLIVDDAHATVTASYVSDALRQLLSAVCRLLSEAPEATARFDEEPGEYRWRLFRIDDDRLRIPILAFDDNWPDKSDADGQPIFDVQCRLRTFAGAVCSGCKDLLARHGRDGYKEKWGTHDFPDAEHSELKRLLDVNRRDEQSNKPLAQSFESASERWSFRTSSCHRS